LINKSSATEQSFIAPTVVTFHKRWNRTRKCPNSGGLKINSHGMAKAGGNSQAENHAHV